MVRTGIVSRIASCHDCDWGEEDYDSSTMQRASRHAKKHDHHVSVEVATNYEYCGSL